MPPGASPQLRGVGLYGDPSCTCSVLGLGARDPDGLEPLPAGHILVLGLSCPSF